MKSGANFASPETRNGVEIMLTNDLVIRPVAEGDEATWKRLYHSYRDFYELAPDEVIVNRVWSWVLSGGHSIYGIIAIDAEGNAVGLANLRVFARPSSGSIGVYLDDLFTDSDYRRHGIGAALLAKARRFAGEHDATVVRWITSTDNTTARSLYDANAVLTKWVTYDMPPERPAQKSRSEGDVETTETAGMGAFSSETSGRHGREVRRRNDEEETHRE
ncbi:N-acetyltransferase [Rathayibacter rathayi]|uniref:N-acetyltransferase n=2 Tax=Rathayibacter rathayi TaxID=33887 RepID=A0ABD6WAR5_RATRA|nr:GNAT family N-acetyltransferase [Rathayibacter rathayi]AZZ49000.1 N-acetyltransferase [Rathayibacter rathayi]MWV74106.1 GNAT family N-acetyltransferase [Rathayibacter rathayi NCPPB 2980 = VKM Ac-1601]PPF15134.1 N-acetyltransferase [Rathayibacter rathayi]PPF51181.1 N-acetyltransferase [Rathayibacter rathayi]PPF82814.1 N-acetyltransferase [Rathayibacter rathayi]